MNKELFRIEKTDVEIFNLLHSTLMLVKKMCDWGNRTEIKIIRLAVDDYLNDLILDYEETIFDEVITTLAKYFYTPSYIKSQKQIYIKLNFH